MFTRLTHPPSPSLPLYSVSFYPLCTDMTPIRTMHRRIYTIIEIRDYNREFVTDVFQIYKFGHSMNKEPAVESSS